MTVQDDAAQKFGLGFVVTDKLHLHCAVDNSDIDNIWLLAQPLGKFIGTVKATDGQNFCRLKLP